MSTIRVQPAARLRQEFAVWAIAQQPKIRTVAPNTFAVPSELYTEAPEAILIGSLVDGQRYVSPDEVERQAPVEPAWQPPVLPEQEAVPGEALPPVPEEAYGPDAVPLDPPVYAPGGLVPVLADDNDRSDSSGDEDQADEDGFPCGLCDRSLKTARGRDTHRRTAHHEES